jgi:hypothetical protein
MISVAGTVLVESDLGLLQTLTYTSKLTVRGGYEPNCTTKEMISIFPL